MKTTETGGAAETATAKYLETEGYKIIARNWRTPGCEIDIVASRGGVVYFVEVKYRTTAVQGEGWEYITAKKRQQMEYAANNWLAANNWTGECRLMAASVSGEHYETIELIEI